MASTVAIDGFRLITEPLTSGALYVSELVQAFANQEDIERIYLLLPRSPASNFIYASLLEQKNVEVKCPRKDVFPEIGFRQECSWIQFVIPKLLRNIRCVDYYIAPYHHPPILIPRKVQVVTVIHDLCGLRGDCGYRKISRGFYQHLFRFITAAIRSDVLIPISHYTKRQLLDRFPFLSGRVSKVIHNAVSSSFVDDVAVDETLQKFALCRRTYFLAFGSPGLRKGLDLVLGAYKLYRNRRGEDALVLITPSQHRPTVSTMVRREKLEDVIIVSDLEGVERDSLYRRAVALLFPSRCEGFGYPIVEAMRQGCPAVTHKEGPSSELVDPSFPMLRRLDIHEIAEHMEKLSRIDPETKRELAEQLIRRSLLFTSSIFKRNFLKAMMALN